MTFLSTSEIYDNMHPVSATTYSTIHNDTSKHHVLQNTCHATHPYTPAPQNVACPARTHRDDPKSHASPQNAARAPTKSSLTIQNNHCATRTCTPAFGSGAPATTRHRATIQNGHRTTRTRTPTFKNAARATTKHHIPMTTAPHAHTRQASKCSRHHNETPRYDSKWSPRHTIQNDHRATRTHTPSVKMQPAPQRNTTLRFKMATAPHAHARPASKCSPHHNGTPRYDRK